MDYLDKLDNAPKIVVLRSTVSVALIASAAIVAAFSYILLTKNERELNNSLYDSISDHMLRVISEDLERKDLEILATAKNMAYNHPDNTSWPYINMAGFYDTGRTQIEQSSLHQFVFLPIVQPSQLAQFEQYMHDYFQSEPTIFSAQAGQHSFGFGVYAKDAQSVTYHDTTGEASLYLSKYQLITPVLQLIYDDNTDINELLTFNIHSESSVGPAIEAVMDCTLGNNYTIASQHCGRVSACLSKALPGGTLSQYSNAKHLAMIVQPIMLNHKSENLVGFIAGSVDWRRLIANSIPAAMVDGVDIVVNYGAKSFTYFVDDNAVLQKGDGDLHDSEYDDYKRQRYVYSNDMGHAESTPRDIWIEGIEDGVDTYHYTVTFYPTDHFYDNNYTSHTPLYVSIASGALIVFCSIIFFSYDVLVSRESSRKNAVLDTKRRFVRFISHEIRTPLNSVHLGLEALYDELKSFAIQMRKPHVPVSTAAAEDKVSAALDSWLELAVEMKGNSESAVDVLNDLLNYDKIEMGTLRLEFSSVPIWQVVEKCTQTFQMQAKQKSIHLTLRGACWDAPQVAAAGAKPVEPAQYAKFHVIGDSGRLSQVLRNLISNALKFTPVRGDVRVSAEWIPEGLVDRAPPAVPADQTDLLKWPRTGAIRVSVTDSGAGLSPQQLAEICSEGVQFNANQLQAGQGSGLGLFISKGLVELHGGKLTVTSEGLGKGATFTVELPLFEVATEESPTRPSSSGVDAGDIEVGFSGSSSKALTTASSIEDGSIEAPTAQAIAASVTTTVAKKVLVVDDAPSNRKMLIRLLAAKGYICEQAEDGQLAIDAYQALIARGERLDAIVMDYEMPVMNGPTAARKLRELGCTTLIVGVTGNLLPEDVTFYKNQGANAVLGKPLNMVMFEELVGNYYKN